MSTEANKDVVRQSIAALNGGSIQGYMDLVSKSYRHHDPGQPSATDYEGLHQFLHGIWASFPDTQITIEDLVAEGDRVAKRYTVQASHGGDFAGVPATGNPVTFTGVTVYRLEDGKFAEGWWNYDVAAILMQIGAIPQPA